MQIFYSLDQPDEFKVILEWYIDYEVEVIKGMYEAEADIIGAGETSAYFMYPKFFEKYCPEAEKIMYKKINHIELPYKFIVMHMFLNVFTS